MTFLLCVVQPNIIEAAANFFESCVSSHPVIIPSESKIILIRSSDQMSSKCLH